MKKKPCTFGISTLVAKSVGRITQIIDPILNVTFSLSKPNMTHISNSNTIKLNPFFVIQKNHSLLIHRNPSQNA
jgi:hypothetical protein